MKKDYKNPPSLFYIFILLLLCCPLQNGICSDSGDVFLNISIGAMDNHSFESPSCDWTFDTYDKAVMRTVITNLRAHSGIQSLKLDCHLNCTSSNSGAAKWVMASPTNMFNKTISAYVWCPRGSGGPASAPNGLTLYAKVGSGWTWKDGGWNNIGSLTNQWIHLTWTLSGSWAQTNLMEIGVKYGASGSCTAANWYTGPIFLDDVTW
jgi:hypothetical protein